MKTIARLLLVGTVAATAIAISAVPSEAKKRAKGPKPGVYWGQLCTAPGNKVMVWGADNKWYPSLTPVCAAPFCPAAC